jgi:hypothetical protein
MIDFGRVCVGSMSAKNFVVFNGLKKSIRISIDELEMELQQSKALTQVIPEGCLAGFDIYFTCRNLGKHKKSFTWKINDLHSFKVHVVAEVVPIEVQMSRSEAVMEFPADSLKPTLSTDIILTNPGNAFADFLWGSAGAFTCDPEKGSIAPGKAAVISLTWDPHSSKRTEEEIGLHITGGVDQVLKVRGILLETRAEFSDKKVVLGTMAVGTEKEVFTTISNIGENPLVFFMNSIDPQLGIKVEPTEGFVAAKESLEVRILVTPRTVKSYDNIVISAKVRGGKSISLRLSGSSIFPQVEVEQSSFKFGAITVDTLHRLPITLSNRSPIAATLLLDLSSFPDFVPCLFNLVEGMDLPTKEFGPVPVVQEDETGNQIILLQQKLKSIDDKASDKKGGKRKSPSNCWKLTLPPSSTLSAELIFHPTGAKKYSFKLPLQLLGVSEDKSLNRDVSAVAVASVLSVSSNVVDFGDKVVSRDPLSRVSYFLETTITNIGPTGISFTLQEGEEVVSRFDSGISSVNSHRPSSLGAPQQIFFISPVKFDLAAGASTKLRVTFQPQENANYCKRLGIFLKDQEDTTRPYLSLLCVGSGVYPCMSFNTECVILPPVPVGSVSRATFNIFNHGYASLEIKHRISPNLNVPLEVSYPDGNQVGIMVERIRVIVSCKNEHPISWSGKIEFYDMDGERFFLSVCGTSDNCLLSNYWFVHNYSSEFGFIGLEDQPVQYLPLTQIQELRQAEAKRREEQRRLRSLERQKAVESKLSGESKASEPQNKKKTKEDSTALTRSQSEKIPKDNSFLEQKFSSYIDGVDVEKIILGLPEETEVKFLLKWMNRTIPLKKPFDHDNFPLCLFEDQGDSIVDAIELMSGKKISLLGAKIGFSKNQEKMGDEQKRSSEKSKLIAAADKTLFKYQQIINFLISNGALLNHINAIWLLNKDEYLLMLEHELTKDKSVRFTPAAWNLKRKQWDAQWLEFCRRSWLEVLLQAIKIFVLSRVSYKDFSALPGVVLPVKDTPVTSNQKAGKKEEKKQQQFIPKDLNPSNVFTHSEQVLLSWVSYHLDRAEGLPDEGATNSNNGAPFAALSNSSGLNKRVADLAATFSNFFPFCQLFHSHVSDATLKGEPLSGYSALDRNRTDDIFVRFEECLVQYHSEIPGISSDEILRSLRNVLLLLLHLYLNLPHLLPKTKIEFAGMLGSPIYKKIELKNPAKKPIVYSVTLKGSNDYSVEREKIMIAPESSVDYLLTLNARFMHSVVSKIFFWNVKDPTYANGPTLCFQCYSTIKGIQSLEKVSKQLNLFEFETFPLQIKNPYNRDITVRVKLDIKFCQKTLDDCLGKGKRKVHNEVFKDIPLVKPVQDTDGVDFGFSQDESKQNNDDWDLENMFRQPFWCVEETISIPKGSNKLLNLFLLPFQMGKYVCQVIFIEPELGEFSHEVTADVLYPKPTDKLSVDLVQGNVSRLQLAFSSKNSQFEKALSVLTETRIKNANKKIRARSVITNFMTTKVANEDFGSSAFVLDFTNLYFTYTKKFNLVSEYLKWSPKAMDRGSNNIKLKKCPKSSLEVVPSPESTDSFESNLNRSMLNFAPEKAGVYKTIALVRPEDNPLDIRCVELTLTAKIPDAKMLLEFQGPARTKLVQEIPILNDTNSDWSLTVTLSGRNFSAPKVINVASRNRAVLDVSFYSLIEGNFEGKLQLKNSESGDVFDYQIIGISEEPLAEDTLRFKCAARKKSTFSVTIPPLEAILGSIIRQQKEDDIPTRTFMVESDLPFTQYKEKTKLSVEGGNFDISVNSPMGGELNGYISFRDMESQIVFWYAVVVEVTSPSEERSIDVGANVRQAVAIEILLDNPLKDDLLFDVSIVGNGLIGESSFCLKGKTDKGDGDNLYELIYSPLIAGTFVGKISFWNELVGEIWYKLNLTAQPAPAIVIPTVECMLGDEISFEAAIENPLNEAVSFQAVVGDEEHFSVKQQSMSLAPFEQSKFQIRFRATSFQDICSSSVKLFNKKLGEIVYEVSGKGLLPGVMRTTAIDGPLHDIVSENIAFRNPYNHPLPIEVYLAPPFPTTNSTEVFSLLLRKSNEIVVPPKALYHIPISFSPSVLGVWECVVQVRAFVSGHNLLWCYPIQGTAEVGTVIKLSSMKTMSKTSLIQEQLIHLTGLFIPKSAAEERSLTLSDFNLTLKIEENLKKLVSRSFKIQPLEVIRVNSISSDNQELALRTRLLFEPLRIFSAKVEISITAKNRGKWKAVVDLEATNPEPDDTIKLTAKVGDSDRVAFKLNNRFLGFSPFQAFFTSNSSPHFSVQPTSGLLAPYDGEGTSFLVSFAPKEYGYIEQ